MITQVDLIRQGQGSGTDPNKALTSDGQGGWELKSLTYELVGVSGTQDGVNKVFTLLSNVSLDGSEQVYVNGLLMKAGASNDYLLTATNQLTFQAAMFAPASDDTITVYGTALPA